MDKVKMNLAGGFGLLRRKASSSYDSDSSIDSEPEESPNKIESDDSIPQVKKSNTGFTDTFTSGTSKFFNSVIAKKNGLVSRFEKLELSPKKSANSVESDNNENLKSDSLDNPNQTKSTTCEQTLKKEEAIANGHGSTRRISMPVTPTCPPTKITKQITNAEVYSSPDTDVSDKSTENNTRPPLERKPSKPGPPRPPRPKLEKKPSISGEEVFLKETYLDEKGRRKGKRRNSLLINDDDEEREFFKAINGNPEDPGAIVNEFKVQSEPVPLAATENRSQVDLINLASMETDRAQKSGALAALKRLVSQSSSEAEFGGDVVRSPSQDSEISCVSSFSSDSQMDEDTAQTKEFMKTFVEQIFSSEPITQIDKAKFGQLCQTSAGRLWFSRHVSSQRVNHKKVDETIFFQLIQYFAIVLFECNESEDFSPAKTLMNMSFTFITEGQNAKGLKEKQLLYSYLTDQPIWKSLRFWNAAFYDAVNNERIKKKVCTSGDEKEEIDEDVTFQQNIFFGQLGTFTCNMRALGLDKELCLEFLRKQATIADLRKDQYKMLRDSVDKAPGK